MLDNVIDLNALPVPQATITNRKYRAIGLARSVGTTCWRSRQSSGNHRMPKNWPTASTNASTS